MYDYTIVSNYIIVYDYITVYHDTYSAPSTHHDGIAHRCECYQVWTTPMWPISTIIILFIAFYTNFHMKYISGHWQRCTELIPHKSTPHSLTQHTKVLAKHTYVCPATCTHSTYIAIVENSLCIAQVPGCFSPADVPERAKEKEKKPENQSTTQDTIIVHTEHRSWYSHLKRNILY